MKDEIKVNLLGAYLLFILFVFIVVPVVVYFSDLTNQLVRSLIFVGFSGGIGGTIYSIRGFYQNLGEGIFKFNWVWWYIFRPIISVVIGVFVYFFIFGGLMGLGLISGANYSKGLLFYCAVSFLAGFSFTQFANKLEDTSSILFTKKKNKHE